MDDFEQIQGDWIDLAEIDPMWAICADSGRPHGKWAAEEFFETGERRIERLLKLVHNSGQTIDSRGTALDFGCGVGRITQALAEKVGTC